MESAVEAKVFAMLVFRILSVVVVVKNFSHFKKCFQEVRSGPDC